MSQVFVYFRHVWTPANIPGQLVWYASASRLRFRISNWLYRSFIKAGQVWCFSNLSKRISSTILLDKFLEVTLCSRLCRIIVCRCIHSLRIWILYLVGSIPIWLRCYLQGFCLILSIKDVEVFVNTCPSTFKLQNSPPCNSILLPTLAQPGDNSGLLYHLAYRWIQSQA